MKLLRVFGREDEGRMAQGRLRAQGIEAELRGAKSYTTHVIGGFGGRYELLVPENQFLEAYQVAQEWETAEPQPDQAQAPGGGGSVVSERRAHLRRSFTYAMMSVLVLPWVFNVVSLRILWRAVRDRSAWETRDWGWAIASLVVNGVGVAIGALIVGFFSQRFWPFLD
jgi:hypothetical protein